MKSALYSSFAGRYIQLHNKMPKRYAVLGYDAAKLLLTLIQQGATTRERMSEALSGAAGMESLHARFTFKSRVNSWLHILQFTNDGINHLSEISVE
jgi:ABC-type branched-subunit amino acid transport system substrate-binding protein